MTLKLKQTIASNIDMKVWIKKITSISIRSKMNTNIICVSNEIEQEAQWITMKMNGC